MRGVAVALLFLLIAPLGAIAVPDISGPSRTFVEDPSLEPLRGRVAPGGDFVDGRSTLELRADGEPVHFSIHSILVLPESSILLESEPSAVLRYAGGSVRPRGAGRWVWEAPLEPGIHALRVEAEDGRAVDLVAFVLHPRPVGPSPMLGGYRIGAYRTEPLGGRAEYLPPAGFIEASSSEEDIRISPHFTLGELLCKQPGNPRYLTFTPELVTKLETVLEAVNARGIEVGTLTVMSGFRTPWYNRAIGNTTDYSRHLWGDAADIYIDRDGNGDMDDLNGDGRSTIEDARVLAGIVESVSARGLDEFTPGGLSVYRRNAVHGPFVHVDARGVKARW